MAIIPNNLVDQLEEKVGDALIQLESVEEVVQAKVNKEMLKEWKAKKLAELQLKEERDGVTQSSKQDRNARASKEWDQYLKELSQPNADSLLRISNTFGYAIDDLLKIEIEKANKFKSDSVEHKNNDTEVERLEKLVLDYKEQLLKKDKYIEELIQDKNVFRNQAEKYMQLLTENKK